MTPALRTRIQCLVRSTHAETRLPPALNDILLAHPIPAVVSRFRLSRCRGIVTPSFKTIISHEEVYNYCVSWQIHFVFRCHLSMLGLAGYGLAVLLGLRLL